MAGTRISKTGTVDEVLSAVNAKLKDELKGHEPKNIWYHAKGDGSMTLMFMAVFKPKAPNTVWQFNQASSFEMLDAASGAKQCGVVGIFGSDVFIGPQRVK